MRSKKSGQKKPLGMRAIARKAGVAPITVSRALADPDKVSPDTRRRIMKVIKQEDFIPDRMAGSMRNSGKIIGTVVPALINTGIAEQVQGMADACHENRYQLLLVQGEFTLRAEEEAIRSLVGWRPSGLILQAFVESAAVRDLLRRREMPVVEISEVREREPLDLAVGVSNFDTAYAMTAHLIAKGYQRIGFVNMAVNANDRLRQRRVGYRKALKDHGLAYEPRREIEVEVSPHGGAVALRRLTELDPDIEAIFCSSDAIAIGTVQECHRLNWKVPERIAIAGYGDLDIAAELYPSLTTVRVPRYEMGRRAVEELLKRIRGETPSSTVVELDFEIIDRQSA